ARSDSRLGGRAPRACWGLAIHGYRTDPRGAGRDLVCRGRRAARGEARAAGRDHARQAVDRTAAAAVEVDRAASAAIVGGGDPGLGGRLPGADGPLAGSGGGADPGGALRDLV